MPITAKAEEFLLDVSLRYFPPLRKLCCLISSSYAVLDSTTGGFQGVKWQRTFTFGVEMWFCFKDNII